MQCFYTDSQHYHDTIFSRQKQYSEVSYIYLEFSLIWYAVVNFRQRSGAANGRATESVGSGFLLFTLTQPAAAYFIIVYATIVLFSLKIGRGKLRCILKRSKMGEKSRVKGRPEDYIL
jgi:hypothetical protein